MSIDYSSFAFPKPSSKAKIKTQIKKKSKKLAKKERERFSILQEDKNKCFLCHRQLKLDKHEALGGRNRQLSMKYGLVYYLCRKCHSEVKINIEKNDYLKGYAEKIFEKEYPKLNFKEIFK